MATSYASFSSKEDDTVTLATQVNRFSSSRKSFNFDTLDFRETYHDTASTSLASSVDMSSENFFSKAFTDKLDMSASQKIMVKYRNSTSRPKRTKRSRYNAEVARFGNKLAFNNAPMTGRSEEMKRLLNAYQDKSIRLAMIDGVSGSGKTRLAKQLRERALKDNGLLCLGKFDLQNRADPYHGIVNAMNNFLSQIQNKEDLWHSVLTDLTSKFSLDDCMLLMEILPSFAKLARRLKHTKTNKSQLKKLIQSRTHQTATDDRSITDRARRIQHVFIKFLQVVCTEKRPLVLCLDDIQWSGRSSLSLIDTLMTAEHLEHLFLVATCRSEFLEETQPQSPDSKNNELHSFLVKHARVINRIQILSLKEADVQEIVNVAIRLKGKKDKTLGLSRIVTEKTGGNPYFVMEFLRLLNDEELLSFNEEAFEWEWVEGKIQEIDADVDVAQTVHNRLSKMPPSSLFLAQIIACISKRVNLGLLDFVLSGLKNEFEFKWDDIVWPQDTEESLLYLERAEVLECDVHGETYFVHDHLQHASYEFIPAERVGLMKKCIGKRLISGMNVISQDEMLFTAVALVGSAIKELSETEKRDFSFWAFLAGDTALQQGAFEFALTFFGFAIDCLGRNPFGIDAELALPVFSGAAEAAIGSYRSDLALKYASVVKSQNVPEIKKTRARLAEMKVHNAMAQRKRGISVFCNFVNRLGAFKLQSTQPGMAQVGFQILKTLRFIKKFDASKFLTLPESENPALAASITAFSESLGALFIAGPNLFVVATCKALRSIAKHGISRYGPIVLACFGTILSGMGKRARGLEFGEVALELCEKHKYIEALPMCVLMVFDFVRPWLKPLGDFESPVRYTLECATRNGQIELIQAMFYLNVAMCVETQRGTLQDVIQQYETFYPKYQDFKGGRGGIEANIQFAYKLASPSRDNTSLNGHVMHETDAIKFAEENSEDFVPYMIDYFKLQLLMHLGDPVKGAKCTKKAEALGIRVLPSSHYAMRGRFVVGMVNVMAYHKTKRTKYMKKLQQMRAQLKEWQKNNNPNVLPFMHFLNGEWERIRGNFSEAKKSFEITIILSRRLGFRMDAAFANERLCALVLAKDPEEAREYLLEAISLYDEYGAGAKVHYLKQEYEKLLESAAPSTCRIEYAEELESGAMFSC